MKNSNSQVRVRRILILTQYILGLILLALKIYEMIHNLHVV